MSRFRKRLTLAALTVTAFGLQACSPDATSPLAPSDASLTTGPPPPWSVTKTANSTGGPSFDWDVEKTISPGSLVLNQGETGTFNYTITATRTAGAASSTYTVSGEICVANNSGAPSQDLVVEDRLWLNGVVDLMYIVVDVADNPVLENGESHCYPYSYDMPEGFVPDSTATYFNKAYVFNTQMVDSVAKPVRVSETRVAFSWPAASDASATVVDTLTCPEGFTCTPNGGVWVFEATGSRQLSVSVTNVNAPCGSEVYVNNRAVLTESNSGDTDEATAAGLVNSQECAPPPSIEGCTPGYWKQDQHFDSWVSYTQDQDFDTVFGVSAFSPDRTLLVALSSGGGGVNRLGRHATAALLNAATSDVQYGMSTAQVIALVQQAVTSGDYDLASSQFEELNELGCPLN